MAKALLIIGCSNLKHNLRGTVKAFDLYDGVFYKVLKKAFREEPELEERVEILIVSAKYGLITKDAFIELYDQKMNRQRAEELLSENTGILINFTHGKTYSSAAIAMGKDYRSSIDWAKTGIKPYVITGGIGVMQKKLGEWIRAQKEVANES